MKSVITAIIVSAIISAGATAAVLIDGHSIKNHSIPVTKLTAGAVRSLHGRRGPQGSPGAQGIQGAQGAAGPQGARGPQGVQGVPGPPGLSGYVSGTAADSTVSVAAGAQGTAHSWCPAGTQPLGGGYFSETAGDSALRTVSAAFAIDDVTGAPGFQVTMANEGGAAESFHVQVRCAHVS
jgi:hypothetical protein